jgi:hypothetical protein
MAEVYRVGVALALSSNHAQVLGALTQHLLGVQTSVNQLQNRFSSLGLAIGGAFAMITGGLILRGLESIIRKTADLSQELARIQMLGISAQETARIREQAGRIASRTPGMTSKDALEAYGQTYSLLGGEEAEKLMEPLTRLRSAMVAVSGKEVTSEQLRSVTRAADQLGRLNDPKTGQYDPMRFSHFLDIVAKTYSSTHGQVGPREWEMMGRTGGPAFMGQSDRGLMTAAISAQIMGAYRTGTAEMSLYQQFVGGRMGRSQAEALVALGILSPRDVRESGRGAIGHHLHARYGPRGIGRTTGGSEGGRMNLLNPEGQRKLAEYLGDNPLEAAGRMRAAMEAKGISDPKEQLQQIFKIYGRQTTQRLMADIVRSFTQITGEIGRLESSADMEAIIKIAHDTSIPYNLIEINAAWKDLLYTISESFNVIGFLHGFTDSIKGINASLKGVNPTILKAVAGGLAAIGVLLIGAGGVALLAALGIGGWLVVGIGALGAVLAITPWKTIFDEIVAGLNRFQTRLAAIGKWLGITLPATPDTGALSPGFTSPNQYGQWSPAQRLGAGMTPISYHPGGGLGGRFIGGGLHGGGGYKMMPGTDGSPRIPSLPSLGTRGGGFLTDGGGASIGGGHLGSAFGRARFEQELAAKPWLRNKILRIAHNEQGTNALGTQGILESMMNRAVMRGTSLEKEARWTGEHGYYAQGGMGRGALENPRSRAILENSLSKVLGGSNITGYATDNSSGGLARREKASGKFIWHKDINGESFFHPGWAEPKFAGRWGELYGQTQAEGMHGAALARHFGVGHRGRHDPEHPSSAIPRPRASSLETPIVMHMDGDVVARGAMKRIVGGIHGGGLNGPARGGRLPDFSATRPVSI